MAARLQLAEQLETIERLLERAKAEQDWPTIAPLKATAELVHWTMTHAETLKVANTVVTHPAVGRCWRECLGRRSQSFGD